MYFNEQVIFNHMAPKDCPKWIKPKRFEKMTEEQQYYYDPVYAKYKTIKERSYSECEECGTKTFEGWVSKEIPIGEPIRYVLGSRFMPYWLTKSFNKAVTDTIYHSNILAAKILK